MHRIALDPAKDHQLTEIAQARGISSDELILSYIHSGLEQSGRGHLWGVATYLGACIITAGLVLVGIHFFHLAAITVSSSFPLEFLRLLHWLRVFVFAFTPWPITILIVLWMIAQSNSAIPVLLGFFGNLRKLKLFGTEFELNEQTKRKIQSASSEIDSEIQEYKKRADKEVTRKASLHQVDEKLSKLFEDPVIKNLVHNRHDFRCTIHIRDPIEYGRLYQLLDYYPTGAGSSRTLSMRYGIIGKVWRTDQEIMENDLHAQGKTRDEILRSIVRDWGMTMREAEHAYPHRSYFCFPLKHEGEKVGLVFMDSTHPNAFQESHKAKAIELANKELSQTISKLLDGLSAISTQLDRDKA